MADRAFKPGPQALEPKTVLLTAQVAIGAIGAPTLSAANSKGFKSVTRNSAGNYTFTLGTPSGATDKYQKIAFVGVEFVRIDAATAPAAPLVSVVARTPSSGTFQILCEDADTPAATDPASGETMLLTVLAVNGS